MGTAATAFRPPSRRRRVAPNYEGEPHTPAPASATAGGARLRAPQRADRRRRRGLAGGRRQDSHAGEDEAHAQSLLPGPEGTASAQEGLRGDGGGDRLPDEGGRQEGTVQGPSKWRSGRLERRPRAPGQG